MKKFILEKRQQIIRIVLLIGFIGVLSFFIIFQDPSRTGSIIYAEKAPSGHSLTIYYRTENGMAIGGPAPQCPLGWTNNYTTTSIDSIGWGPHFIAIQNLDWYGDGNPGGGGTGGGGGGFGGSPPLPIPPRKNGPPDPPGAFGGAGSSGSSDQSFHQSAFGMGGDFVCSDNEIVVVPATRLYLNSISSNNALVNANACATDSVSGINYCNRCLVCTR